MGQRFVEEAAADDRFNTFMLANDGSRHGGHNSIDVRLAVHSFNLMVQSILCGFVI